MGHTSLFCCSVSLPTMIYAKLTPMCLPHIFLQQIFSPEAHDMPTGHDLAALGKSGAPHAVDVVQSSSSGIAMRQQGQQISMRLQYLATHMVY